MQERVTIFSVFGTSGCDGLGSEICLHHVMSGRFVMEFECVVIVAGRSVMSKILCENMSERFVLASST